MKLLNKINAFFYDCFNKKIYRLIFLFFIPIIQLLLYFSLLSRVITDWQSVELTFNYSFGFIRRGILGTILQYAEKLLNINNHYLSLAIFQSIMMLIFVASVMIFIKYIIDKTDNAPYRNYVFYACLLFLSLGGVGFYIYDWAEIDVAMIPLAIISLFAILKEKYLFIVPINCAISILIHEGYPLMFFGIVFFMLLYKWRTVKSKDMSKRYLIIAIISGLLTSALFIYFYFMSHVKDSVTIAQMVDNAARYTPRTLDQDIEYLFFDVSEPMGAYFIDGKPTINFVNTMRSVGIYLIYCMPVIIMLFNMFRALIKAQKNAFDKLIYLAISLGSVLTIPLIIIHTDTGRWMYDLIFYYFSAFAVMLLSKNDTLIKYLESKKDNIFRRIMCIVPVIYFCTAVYNKWYILSFATKFF